MKCVVTGANGFLGQYLVRDLIGQGHRVYALGRGPSRLSLRHPDLVYCPVEVTDRTSFHSFFEASGSVDVMIHAAALTQVDYCEEHREEAVRVNVEGTRLAAGLAESFCKHLIYVSTDFVFDGRKGNYRESDPPAPVNFYGETKLQAERIIQACAVPWSIVRTCLVYGNALSENRSNIVSWVKEALDEDKAIKVVSDQLRTPTYIEDLSAGIGLVVQQKALGLFHISGKETMTPYDMALRVAEYFHLDAALLERVDASTFTQRGMRPLRTGFSIARAEQELGFTPLSFEESLHRMYGIGRG